MATTKGFWQDNKTGEIYAIESSTFGKIVGAAGPLDQENLKDLEPLTHGFSVRKSAHNSLSKKGL